MENLHAMHAPMHAHHLKLRGRGAPADAVLSGGEQGIAAAILKCNIPQTGVDVEHAARCQRPDGRR
jgi:hypothetical protein